MIHGRCLAVVLGVLMTAGSLPAQRLFSDTSPEPGGDASIPGGPSAPVSAGETGLVDPAELRAFADELRRAEESSQGAAEPSGVDLLSLFARGGGFMIPITLMSFFVVALSAERLLSLRTGKVIPHKLERHLRELASDPDRFEPGDAYRRCQQRRSPTGRVIAAMMLRTGQPLGEIERTASEAVQREADAYVGPIRWLNLAAAATPLMGLLGTVWGMIKAFHQSTSLAPGMSRSEQLSEGIYTALVTTLAGLAVAIPAAILAQYFENRITKLFHRIELLAFDVAPGLARFAGQAKLGRDGSLKPLETPPRPVPPPMLSRG